MKEEILVPFAPILMESTRSIGYTFESALSDIIDNSISSGAQNIDVIFDTINVPILSVLDDGSGMTETELIQAMRYGSRSSLERRDSIDLGRFGLGLKTASLSQCRILTVISKKNGVVSSVCWDLDYIIRKGDWILKVFPTNEIEKMPMYRHLISKQSGTIVTWENFDKLETSTKDLSVLFNEKIELSREHVALVFHRYIEPDDNTLKVNICFNNERLIAKDPFLSKNPATQLLPTESIPFKNGVVNVKPYILPYFNRLKNVDKQRLGSSEDLRQDQGFYIYRNKRLIIWGTWFRLIKQNELSKLARVKVDIPNELDQIWEIDVKKSTASVPDLLKQNLIRVVKGAIDRSENVFRYRGRKEVSDDLTHVWDLIDNRGSYKYKINRELEIFKIVENLIQEDKLSIFYSFINLIEEGFPYQDVYYRLAKNQNSIKTDDDDELLDKVKDIFNLLNEQLGSIEKAMSAIESIDYYAKNKHIIEQLKKEILK
jgi:hypothetical protein